MEIIPPADQGESQSVESRIANALGFGGESAEPVSDIGETPLTDDGFAEIDWEGTKIKVPPKMRDAFMKNEDYTRKTQELAEQRKGIDHVQELTKQRQLDAAFTDSIAAEQREIAVIEAYLQQAKSMDWSQMSTEQILRARVELDNVKDRREQLTKAIDGKRAKFMDEVQNKIKELRGKSRELASKSIPDFSEEAEKAVRKYAQETEGLTEAEVDNVLLDPRSYKILWKAMQFDRVKATTGKVDTTTRTLRPGAASERMPEAVKDKLNYGKAIKAAKTSGDKARVIEQRLEGLFSRGRQ